MNKSSMAVIYGLFLAFFVTVPPTFGVEKDSASEPTCSMEAPHYSDLQAVEEVSNHLFQIQLRNGMTFELSSSAPQGNHLAETLSPEQQRLFFSRRKEFLTQFARFLAYPRLIGSMSWAKSKIKGCFGKKEFSVAEDLVQISLSEDMQKTSSIRKAGYQTIAKILQVLDTEIWNDSHVFINAKSKSTSLIFGFSMGMAAPKLGFYKMRGLQLDFGYDFETKESFFKRHWVKQSLKSALLCLESMIVGGLIHQYQLDYGKSREKSTIVSLPFGVAYRSGTNTVGLGYLSGVSLTDLTGVGLLFIGQVEAGAAVMSIGKVPTLFSLYSSDAVHTTAKAWKGWQGVVNRINALLGRKNSCEAALSKIDRKTE